MFINLFWMRRISSNIRRDKDFRLQTLSLCLSIIGKMVALCLQIDTSRFRVNRVHKPREIVFSAWDGYHIVKYGNANSTCVCLSVDGLFKARIVCLKIRTGKSAKMTRPILFKVRMRRAERKFPKSKTETRDEYRLRLARTARPR